VNEDKQAASVFTGAACFVFRRATAAAGQPAGCRHAAWAPGSFGIKAAFSFGFGLYFRAVP
jgi:hypothetical protein